MGQTAQEATSDREQTSGGPGVTVLVLAIAFDPEDEAYCMGLQQDLRNQLALDGIVAHFTIEEIMTPEPVENDAQS